MKKLIRLVKCKLLKKHDMHIGAAWDAVSQKRFDFCKHCSYGEWNKDDVGFKEWMKRNNIPS